MPLSGNKKEKRYIFTVSHLKLISPVFHLTFLKLNPKELLDLQLPIYIKECMQHPQTSHCVPGKSACSRSAVFPPPSPLEQLTAFNKELFVRSSAPLDITRSFRTDVLKFSTAFVMGFLQRPHRVVSLCCNGHKLLQLSPEKGLNSVFFSFRRLATTAENEEI